MKTLKFLIFFTASLIPGLALSTEIKPEEEGPSGIKKITGSYGKETVYKEEIEDEIIYYLYSNDKNQMIYCIKNMKTGDTNCKEILSIIPDEEVTIDPSEFDKLEKLYEEQEKEQSSKK